MDLATWAVAVVFGGLTGLVMSRYPGERNPLRLSLLVSIVIGVVAWILVPASIAGPSLTVGCGVGLVLLEVTGQRPATE